MFKIMETNTKAVTTNEAGAPATISTGAANSEINCLNVQVFLVKKSNI